MRGGIASRRTRWGLMGQFKEWRKGWYGDSGDCGGGGTGGGCETRTRAKTHLRLQMVGLSKGKR